MYLMTGIGTMTRYQSEKNVLETFDVLCTRKFKDAVSVTVQYSTEYSTVHDTVQYRTLQYNTVRKKQCDYVRTDGLYADLIGGLE